MYHVEQQKTLATIFWRRSKYQLGLYLLVYWLRYDLKGAGTRVVPKTLTA
jgi:hypothetical protein